MATLSNAQLDGASSRSAKRNSPSRILLIGRVIAPLALAAAAFLFRRQIVDWIESLSGLGFVFTVVHLYSTAAARLIVGLLAFALFAAIGTALFRHASRRARVVLFASLCAILVAGCLFYSGRGLRAVITAGSLTGCLVAANAISPERWRALLANPRLGRSLDLIFWISIGIELLLPRAYLVWVRQHRAGHEGSDRPSGSLRQILPSSALAAGSLAALAPFPMLMPLGQSMFSHPPRRSSSGPSFKCIRSTTFRISRVARRRETSSFAARNSIRRRC